MQRESLLMGRRAAIWGMAKRAGGLCGAGALTSALNIHGVRALAASRPAPIVETKYGKLRGSVRDGVYTFRGIPYGASTAGRNRFMAPREPESWAGVRDALMNGKIAPQIVPAVGSGPLMWRQQLRESVQSEDCLTLNLFTPGLRDGRKRPVMCWCHGGGGYSYGAGSLSEFDGNNLARRGDVVVVSITHRLNIFGHLDLAGIGGNEYADSANAGILDIRAALQWVQDNIERFGGDPRNVMTFGQSGGGDKVSALCAMPSAKGLFHKAAVQSGSTFRTLVHDDSTKMAESILMKLGLRADQLHDLQNVSCDRLLSASAAAQGERPLRFGPVVDGHILPGRPFDPAAPGVSADVPMIIGTTATETTYMIGATDPAVFDLSEADMRMRLKKIAGDSSEGLIDLYRKNRPEGSPSDIFFAITTDRQMRRSAILQAERKAAIGKASVYMYVMAWKTPVEGGKWRSPHTVEVPFIWDNINESAMLVGTGPELRPLANKMSGAWLAFAHTGSPRTPGLKWPTFTASQRATMIFDNQCKVVNDPDRNERLAIEMSLTPGSA